MLKESGPYYAPDRDGNVGSLNDMSLAQIPSSGIASYDEVLDRLDNFIPSRLRTSQNSDQVTQELHDLATFSTKLAAGEINLPTIPDYLANSVRFSSENRHALLAQSLRGVVASVVLSDIDLTSKVSFKQSNVHEDVEKGIGDMIAMVGRDHIEEVGEAITHLPQVDRVILTAFMGDSLKERVGYPDIHDCDETQVAHYLRDIVGADSDLDEEEMRFMKFPRSEVFDRVDQLLEAISDRSGPDFSPSLVIDAILRAENPQAVMQRLMTITYFTDNLDTFIDLLETSGQTQKYAIKCRRYLDSEKRMEAPSWMKDVDPSHRRTIE